LYSASSTPSVIQFTSRDFMAIEYFTLSYKKSSTLNKSIALKLDYFQIKTFQHGNERAGQHTTAQHHERKCK
jgi:hypothetical protein